LNQSNKNAVMISSKSGMNVDVLLETILSKMYVSMMKVDN
jgi:translation elongation factor EF-4